MKMNFLFFKLIFLALLITINSGCASSGSLKKTNTSETDLSNYKTLVLNVQSDSREMAKEVTQLSAMIVAKLQEKNLFEDIYLIQFTPDAVADLTLNITILDLNRVSSAARGLAGAFAGQAGIYMTADLIDSKTNKTVGSFEAQGKSSGGSVYAGGTQQAIERAAEQIAEHISASM